MTGMVGGDGSGFNQHADSSQTAPSASMELATELRQRITMFYAGDEKYSGPWLTQFQRTTDAWQACTDALHGGPGDSCDQELLQEFCAQTLARLSRTFGPRHPESKHQELREELGLLLEQHARGRAPVWKQLSVAFTAADLWLGSWSPESILSPALLESDLVDLRRELLSLPSELLFCDRALPLDSPKLRDAAATALLDSWETILPFILDMGSGDPVSEAGQCLRVLASWLRVLRKCLRQLPMYDESAPAKKLGEYSFQLVTLAEAAPTEAVDVAQQLARWRCCHNEIAELLTPILDALFIADFDGGNQALLPLLVDLAEDLWPRAAMGELNLNWQGVAEKAVGVLTAAVSELSGSGEDDDCRNSVDADQAFEVWQTFALTLRQGTRELSGPVLSIVQAESSGVDSQGRALESREKRSRQVKPWCPSPQAIASAESLPILFSGLAGQILELLVAPLAPTEEELLRLWDLRKNAKAMIEAWALLVGNGQVWAEVLWAPLTRVASMLSTSGMDDDISDDVWREAEVVFWFSSALVSRIPDHVEVLPVVAAIQEISAIDKAPLPWRALLWASASSFAATAPADQCPLMVEWMLHRAPMAAGAPELMVLTELQYAQALEKASRNLSSESPRVEFGERLATYAFADRPPEALHDDTAKSQATFLRAMRFAMGSNSALVCQGLTSSIIPGLRNALDAEKDMAAFDTDQRWLAAQAFFATMATAVPTDKAEATLDHPAVALWQNNWQYFEDAFLEWRLNEQTEQPRLAAAEAMQAAIRAFPGLLPTGVQLLVKSIAKTELPVLQLNALQDIVKHSPNSAEHAQQSAEALSVAILDACDALLSRHKDLLESPDTMAALYNLLSDAVLASPPGSIGVGPCYDKLRPLLLAQPLRFAGRSLEFMVRALPDCTSSAASSAMFSFLSRLLSPEDAAPSAGHLSVISAALPELLGSTCLALSSQEHLGELEALVPVGEVLWYAADMLGERMIEALTEGIKRVKLPEEWSRSRLQRLVKSRAEWPRKAEWLEQLQQIVQEWQREIRQVTL